jgi:hypothetical protein
MTSYVTPKKGVEFITYISLEATAGGSLVATPTIAAGDFKVSIDGGALANLSTLPTNTPAGSGMVKITLSTSEMNGDNITVKCVDAAGAEWLPVTINIQTSTRQIDDLAYPTTSGRSIDVTAGGEVGIDWANIGSPTTTVNLSGTTVKTATDVETDTQDIQGRLPAALTAGGNIKADALAFSGDTVAADNAEAFFDGTGYAGTNNVIPTVTNLTNAPTNGDLTATMKTSVATAVWDAATASYGAAGSYGLLIETNLDGTVSSRASQTSVDTVDDFLDTEVAAIKAKTDQLTFTTANRVDSQVFGMQNGTITAAAIATDAIDADAIAADAVTEIQSGLSTLTAAGVRTAVGLASANLDAQLTAIDDFLDTEVAAIKTETDKIASIKTKTDSLTFTVAGQVDANIQSVNDVTVTGTGAAGDEWGP